MARLESESDRIYNSMVEEERLTSLMKRFVEKYGPELGLATFNCVNGGANASENEMEDHETRFATVIGKALGSTDERTRTNAVKALLEVQRIKSDTAMEEHNERFRHGLFIG